MSNRRHFLQIAAAAWLASGSTVRAAQRASLVDPMRLGVDDALFDSGLAARLQRGFGVDTGVAVQLVRGPASAVLQALERGERDVALTNVPTLELQLDAQGLGHHRRAVATTDFLLVGPTVLAAPLDAAHDIARALARLAQVRATFVTTGDGSGTHLAEQALWRAARVAPAVPWYVTARSNALDEAMAGSGCTLTERGVWSRRKPVAGYGVLVEGDPRMMAEVHVMQSFRSHHPGAALFVSWTDFAAGRRAVASVAGYRPAPQESKR